MTSIKIRYELFFNETTNMTSLEVKKVLNIVPEILEVPCSRIWISYDKEADVLYINFKKTSHADDSEITDDDIIIRYEKGNVVGITVLNASKKKSQNNNSKK